MSFFFFKQKTAYEMRISDWSSDVCSSDLIEFAGIGPGPFCGMMLADHGAEVIRIDRPGGFMDPRDPLSRNRTSIALDMKNPEAVRIARELCKSADGIIEGRSEEHTSELQSLMRISYAVFCLKKKKNNKLN